MTPFLFLISFFGTKLVGLERTIRFFRALGRARLRISFFPPRASLETVRRRIERGYAFLPLPIQCLDQAIVGWYLANVNGHAGSMKIGISLSPLYSHAWVETPTAILGDVARLADFHVMSEFPPFRLETRPPSELSATV